MKELLAQSPKSKPHPITLEERLTANLYLQTSAEYRACCLQVYSFAQSRLRSALDSARTHSAQPPAIVMDLDETVFDNSAFETFLYDHGFEYSDSLWSIFEEKYPQDVTLIPGAKAFIEMAENLGVSVVFISNRSEGQKASTVNALERLGLNVNDIATRVYLKMKGSSSDKSARRLSVQQRFQVLQYFGDNLRDFSESLAANKVSPDAAQREFLNAIESRYNQVDAALPHWGVDWFVLPNPVYGEWERLIPPDPHTILHPSSMR